MELCRYGSLAFFVSGVFFLLLRLRGEGCEKYIFPLFGVIAAAALALSLFSALRRLPDRETLTVYLCSLVPGGGLLLSAFECGETPAQVPEFPSLPPIRYTRLPFRLGTCGAGIFFAAGALFCPLKSSEAPLPPRELDLKDESAKFSAALETLRQSSPEGERKALPLKKELEETVQKADPAAPGRSYELLYQLNQRLRHELAAENERNGQLLRQVSALQQTIRQLERSGKLEQNAQKVSELLNAMAQKNPRLAEALKKGGFDGSKLTPEEIKRLASALGTEAERLKKSLESMSQYLENSSANDPAGLQNAREELENFIKENVPGCDDMIESLTNREHNGSPGECGASQSAEECSGTPSRGRGDAPLEFSGYTPEYGAKRVDKKIAPHRPTAERDSTLVGRFLSETEQKEEQYNVKGGKLQNFSGHAGARESDLHPAHRRAIRRYFEKGEKR